MMEDIYVLQDKHKDKCAVVVGSGPSILSLTEKHFEGADIVMTLNFSIARIRQIPIGVPLYTMWKDAGHHDGSFRPTCTKCDNSCFKLRPQVPEIMLVHEHESKHCSEDYEPRYIFDNCKMGLAWHNPSICSALKIMEIFGVDRLKLYGFDSYNKEVFTSCYDGKTVENICGEGYRGHRAVMDRVLETTKFKSLEIIDI